MEKKIIYAVTSEGLVREVAGNVYVLIDHGILLYIPAPEWEKYCKERDLDSNSYGVFSQTMNGSFPGVNMIIGGHYSIAPEYRV